MQLKQMKLILELRKLLLISFSFCWLNQVFASSTNERSVVYSPQLEIISFDSLLTLNKTIVFITKKNCIACTSYIMKNNPNAIFIYTLQSKSRLEMMQISPELPPKKATILYAMEDFVFRSVTANEASPIIVRSSTKNVTILDYQTISVLSNSFTLKAKKLKKRLEKC